MLFFAVFTIGYFLGVFTFLAIFPPAVREIEEQEKDARQPILSISEESKLEQPAINSEISSKVQIAQNL